MKNENLQVKVVTKPQFKAIGISILCNDLQSSEYINWDKLWNDFDSRLHEIKYRVNDNITYGIAYCGLRDENDPNTMIKYPDYIYIAAAEVNSFNDIPQHMIKKEIPESLYAVFSYKGKDKSDCVQNLGEIWSYAYYEWLPNSDYIRNEDGIDFEYNENKNKEGYEVNVCIPIKKC